MAAEDPAARALEPQLRLQPGRGDTDRGRVPDQAAVARGAAGGRHPVCSTSTHDLRHQFVSLLIAAGKHPKFIASAARHRDPGFSLRTYGRLFDSMPIAAVEWWDALLWPAGCPYVAALTPGEYLVLPVKPG